MLSLLTILLFVADDKPLPDSATHANRYEGRLLAWLDCRTQFLADAGALSDQQVDELNQTNRKVVADRIDNVPKKLGRHDWFHFASGHGSAGRLLRSREFKDAERTNIPPTKREAIAQLLSKRDERLSKAIRAWVTANVCSQLQVGATQRKRVAAVVAKAMDCRDESGLFDSAGFPDVQLIGRTNIRKLLAAASLQAAVGDHRFEYWQQYTDRPPGLVNLIGRGETPKEWKGKVDLAQQRAMKQLLLRGQIQFDFLTEEVGVPKSLEKKATLLIKGAVQRSVDQWKQKVDKLIAKISKWEPGGRGEGVARPDINQVVAMEIWKKTLARSLSKEQLAAYDASQREMKKHDYEASIQYFVAMIDRELWLNARQRKEITAFVRKVVRRPYYWNHEEPNQEFMTLATIVRHLPAPIEKSMSASQESVLAELRKYYTTRGQYIMFTIGRGCATWLPTPPGK